MFAVTHCGATLCCNTLWCCVSEGMSLDWCKQPDVGLPEPDAVIFLSLDADAAVRRASYGSERYENIAFQRRVADVFTQLKSPYWKVMHRSILKCVLRYFRPCFTARNYIVLFQVKFSVVLYSIRYDMIDDLHWKTDRQAASLI